MTRISIRAVVPILAAAVLVIALVAVLVPSSARASHAPESIFQDDDHLIYANTTTVTQTLNTLAALGVDRLRLTIQWSDIAPDPNSPTEPAGFDATQPAYYADPTYGGTPGVWAPYDRIVELAARRGIDVDFDVTAPGPLWAMQSVPASLAAQEGTKPADHYEPSPTQFNEFVQALGNRYSGTYSPPTPGSLGNVRSSSGVSVPLLPSLTATTAQATSAPPLPRVSYWSIWNEPNQPGWLAPQWATAQDGQAVAESAVLYRSLLDNGISGLYNTGHTFSTDTILVGETAPEGTVSAVGSGRHIHYLNTTGSYDAMPPMVFLRALYCVGAHYRPLRGSAATNLGCPASGSAQAFIDANPGLFYATGFAHHPYDFLLKPTASQPDPDFVPLANLGRLERGLNSMFAAYGVHRRIPIYLTEYGYQTRPPDPDQVVTPAEQATYLNEADYMAWKDPRVRSVSQFLLYDAGPNTDYKSYQYDYWDTFQTGLIYGPGTSRNGQLKPAYYAYRLPLWVPTSTVKRGSKLYLWGMLRMAPKRTAQKALIRYAPPHGRYRTIATVNVPASAVYGYFTARVKLPGSGSLRIGWRAGRTLYVSRTVAVKVKR